MKKKQVQAILEQPLERLWTVQGFGKMSTNVTTNARLHIWDRVLLNPRVPAIHSHSWDFSSFVLAGRMRNLRLLEAGGEPFNKLLVASAGGIVGERVQAFLVESPIEVYDEGSQYKQDAEEIHGSLPEDGTITLVEWHYGPPARNMKVYWRGRSPWIDAKASQATEAEILNVTRNALAVWF